MATDATGTPTSPDSIPKYNTAVDAPSGKGFNAAMDAVQTGLSARASKPSGIVTGEVPVWNGTTWVRSSVTNIGPTSLGSGTPDATKFLRGDGTWQTVTSQKFTTSTWAGGPPGSPTDGDIWIATAVDANDTRWMFQFNTGATTYKWDFIGGPPTLLSDTSGFAINNTATWTSRVTFTASRAGEYRLSSPSLTGIVTVAGNGNWTIGYGVNGVNNFTAGANFVTAAQQGNVAGIPGLQLVSVAGQVINLMYFSNQTGTNGEIGCSVIPVRII